MLDVLDVYTPTVPLGRLDIVSPLCAFIDGSELAVVAHGDPAGTDDMRLNVVPLHGITEENPNVMFRNDLSRVPPAYATTYVPPPDTNDRIAVITDVDSAGAIEPVSSSGTTTAPPSDGAHPVVLLSDVNVVVVTPVDIKWSRMIVASFAVDVPKFGRNGLGLAIDAASHILY